MSFEVEDGEALGVIGRNGAGKSTLLKVLSRITEPTEGRVELSGRVGSLLEVGTGFHPDLTGRENVFLNGAILGMKNAELRQKFDAIVAFAEVEKFIDTPVKHYSTGMYMRLAFAVAAHLEPEVLVVDEVLSVGDASFQKKCLGKMDEVSRRGRTVLFVSHNMAAIRTLCTRTLLMSAGKVEAVGPTDAVVAGYLGAIAKQQPERTWDRPESAPGDERCRLLAVRVRDDSGAVSGEIGSDFPFDIEIDYWNEFDGSVLGTTVVLFDSDGNCVLSSINNHDPLVHGRPRGRGMYRSVCRVPGQLLPDGAFTVSVLLWGSAYTLIHREDETVKFEVQDTGGVRGDFLLSSQGIVRPLLKWRTALLPTPEPAASLLVEGGRV